MKDSEQDILIKEPLRQRRLSDAGRLVPVLALVLMLVPILWVDGRSTGTALIYIFLVWAVLIVLIAGLSRALSKMSALRDADAAKPTPER